MTEKEAKKLIREIGADCYNTVSQWVKDNWSRPVPNAVENYITNSKYGSEVFQSLIDDGYENELYDYLEESAKKAKEATVVQEEMILDKKEFMMVVDSTNGFALIESMSVKDQIMSNIEDSISIDSLHEKWAVDKDRLLTKLFSGTEEQYKELWERIQNFWAKRDKE